MRERGCQRMVVSTGSAWCEPKRSHLRMLLVRRFSGECRVCRGTSRLSTRRTFEGHGGRLWRFARSAILFVLRGPPWPSYFLRVESLFRLLFKCNYPGRGRRMALTFPLLPPPQKNRSPPSDSSPET